MRMKRLILLLTLILISGCNDQEDIKQEKITFFNEEFYQITETLTYFDNKLILHDILQNKFIETNLDYIAFINYKNREEINPTIYGYTLDNNIINLEQNNAKGIYEIKYEKITDITDNCLITYEETITEDGTFIKIKRIYEKIEKEEFIRKIGKTYGKEK